jgi:anti-anti-sigma factor
MAMQVKAQRAGSVVVVDLEGNLTVTADSDQLMNLIERICWLDIDLVVFNMSQVATLDCSGIGQLVGIHNQVRESGGHFVLVNIDPQQKRLLKLMGLLTVFQIPDYEREVMLRGWRAAERARVARFVAGKLPEELFAPEARSSFGGAI